MLLLRHQAEDFLFPRFFRRAPNGFLMNEDANRGTYKKLFSLEEANRLLPTVKKLAIRMVAEHDTLRSIEHDINAARDNALQGGGSRHGMRYLTTIEEFSRVVQKIEALGVLVKDYGSGLCDFPHYRDGRVVFLCWRVGEDEISWWHDTDAGFAGRRRL
jgi:hypothetical protein